MSIKPFQSRNETDRLWDFIDKLSRRAWEREGLSHDQQKEIHDAAAKFYHAITNSCSTLPQLSSNRTPPPSGVDVDDGNWADFGRQELVCMLGRKDVYSISEAYLKALSVLKVLRNAGSGDEHFLFRGQTNIAWKVIPRLGRKLASDSVWQPPDFPARGGAASILPEEIESLQAFQNAWESNPFVDPIDRLTHLDHDNPEWWFRMQHYDTGHGTRLLDVTTSLIAALLFACIDWESGSLDDETDGVIYMWSEGMNSSVDDFLTRSLPSSLEGLFAWEHSSVPKHILNPPHNERSKAQSGAFIWWPRFWEEAPTSAPYFLRVPASAKKDIVKDLLSLGYGPKEAVRNKKGLENEQKLRRALGV